MMVVRGRAERPIPTTSTTGIESRRSTSRFSRAAETRSRREAPILDQSVSSSRQGTISACCRRPPCWDARSVPRRIFRRSGPPVAVLSDAYWERQFGRARDVLGRTIDLNFKPFLIIGVMPREFSGARWPGTARSRPTSGCRSGATRCSSPAATCWQVARCGGGCSRSGGCGTVLRSRRPVRRSRPSPRRSTSNIRVSAAPARPGSGA